MFKNLRLLLSFHSIGPEKRQLSSLMLLNVGREHWLNV